MNISLNIYNGGTSGNGKKHNLTVSTSWRANNPLPFCDLLQTLNEKLIKVLGKNGLVLKARNYMRIKLELDKTHISK
jgi:hypothetical protein